METNRNFARSEDGICLEFAPREFDYNGVHYNATNIEEIYNALGYLYLKRSEIPQKDGFYYTAFYEVEDNVLLQKWEEHKIPAGEEKIGEEEIKSAIEEGVNSIDG